MTFKTNLATSLLVLALLPPASQSAELQGRVVRIVDGDTLVVLDATKTQHKIRLAGIAQRAGNLGASAPSRRCQATSSPGR
jgi:endonuclease YncB( thermonuclease family)